MKHLIEVDNVGGGGSIGGLYFVVMLVVLILKECHGFYVFKCRISNNVTVCSELYVKPL